MLSCEVRMILPWQYIQGNSVSWPLHLILWQCQTSVLHLHLLSTIAWFPILGSDQLAVIFPLPFWAQHIPSTNNLILVKPFSLLHCNSSLFAQILSISLSLTPLLVFSPFSIVCFIWVLPTLPLFLSKSCLAMSSC